MSLVSNAFILFVLAAVTIYYLTPDRAKWVTLLIFSYLYYLSGNAKYVVYLLFSTAVTYGFALAVSGMQERNAAQKQIRRVMICGILLNLGMLGMVKYAGFLVENVNRAFRLELGVPQILLPLGISFFTFQSTGYLLDVYWRKAEAEKNPFRYALFVSFFPQLMQGPIGNYNKLAPQLNSPHRIDLKRIRAGLWRILWGFAKKMIVADWAGVFADAIWGDLDRFNGVALFALLFYGIQLYADFSGAMDVVIGIGSLFGIQMEENFRQPYLATSMADFWKRWHITLGSWMMNYVFYPVSLSRWMMRFSKWSKKKFGRRMGRVVPIALADLIVFFLVGIWHGASWKYVVYGLLNGGIIAFSELMSGIYGKWRSALHIRGKEPWYHGFCIARTFLLVNLRWFFDRSDSLTQGFYMIRQALTHFDASQLLLIEAGREGTSFVPWALLIIAVGCIMMVTVGVLRERGAPVTERLMSLPVPASVLLWLCLLTLIGMFGSTAAPRGFIYAQF